MVDSEELEKAENIAGFDFKKLKYALFFLHVLITLDQLFSYTALTV